MIYGKNSVIFHKNISAADWGVPVPITLRQSFLEVHIWTTTFQKPFIGGP